MHELFFLRAFGEACSFLLTHDCNSFLPSTCRTATHLRLHLSASMSFVRLHVRDVWSVHAFLSFHRTPLLRTMAFTQPGLAASAQPLRLPLTRPLQAQKPLSRAMKR